MKFLLAITFLLTILQALFVNADDFTNLYSGVGGILGFGPFRIDNTNIGVNAAPPAATTSTTTAAGR